jgi:acetyl esterase/lipase
MRSRQAVWRRARPGLAFLAALGLGACADAGGQSATTRVSLAVANLPTLGFGGRVVEDVGFGTQGLALDLYLPPGEAPEGGWPLAVFFHGGAWQTGSKDQYRFVGTALAAEGLAVAIPDYRKFPEVRFPAFMRDAAMAVARAREAAAARGADPGRLLLSGHSAGGHMAALLAYGEGYLREAGVPSGAVAGVAGMAGPYHFTPEAPALRKIFGPPERFPAMWTSRFVDPGEPPILMQIGAEDGIVGRGNVQRLSAALAGDGVCHASRVYAGLDHVGLVAELTWYYRSSSPVFADLAAFLKAAAAGRACEALAAIGEAAS